jgi:UDP-N-acetylmuramoyl-L-alanyl-D-glutamate--2,6-diaminopimelate ligase
MINNDIPIIKKLYLFLKAIEQDLDISYKDSSSLDINISNIQFDSRRVTLGSLFVAVAGQQVDGYEFIPDAICRGASAVVTSKPVKDIAVPYLRVQDTRKALAHLSAAFYDFPARYLTVIGVTCTDGKTTTTNLIFEILKSAGFKTGMVSTVNAVFGDQTIDTGFHVTTPESPDIQRYLAMMVANEITHVVIETTSHGLAQKRVDACGFNAAVVTNITHEHLDYHGTIENYRDAKANLFRELIAAETEGPKIAVLNMDDSSYSYLRRILEDHNQLTTSRSLDQVDIVSYGFDHAAQVKASDISYDLSGSKFRVSSKGTTIPVDLRLPGEFNIYNCLAAIALCHAGFNIDQTAINNGIMGLRNIPGRLESLDMGTEFDTIVDFAHTPNALRSTLMTARTVIANRNKPGRIIAIFGSAGLRDKQKRRMMAEISTELADISILTAEDPRTESLHLILGEMAAGAVGRGGQEGVDFYTIPDRGDAIKFGVSIAQAGDIVMALGKGHEQSMCFGDTEYPWDDRTAMRAAVAEYLGIEGPDMPYLPTQNDQKIS